MEAKLAMKRNQGLAPRFAASLCGLPSLNVGRLMPNARFCLLVFHGLVTVLAAGCSSEATRYPGQGTFTIDGAPAGLTTIKFLPVDPNTDPRHAGMAMADGSGKYAIGGDGKNTGLPAGDYKVTFTQTVDRSG